MSDAIREAFEAWWRGWSNIAPTRQGEGYAEVAENVAWTTWQAALQSSQTAPAVPEGWRQALHDAVSAIYFDDSSDFGSALWSVVGSLSPELAGILESDPSAAWHKSQAMLDAPQPDHSPDAGKVMQGEPVGFLSHVTLKTLADGKPVKLYPEASDWVCKPVYTHPAESREEIQAQALEWFADWLKRQSFAHKKRWTSAANEALRCASRLRASQQEGGE